MADVKKYFFDFVGVRIPISALTMRRSLDAIAFCSVTIPQPDDHSDLFGANPDGEMVISQSLNDGAETVVGTYTLTQLLPTESPSSYTVVLNGEADFQTDQPTTGQTFAVEKPITISQSSGVTRTSAKEDALIVVGDQVVLRDVTYAVKTLSLFVNVKNSRMDLGLT